MQEKLLGQGPQDNESAVEQAKDEQISDFIRDKYVVDVHGLADRIRDPQLTTTSIRYKSTTGSDVPVKDKETRLG